MSDHLKRMSDEHHELAQRADKLAAFINESPIYQALEETDQMLLDAQHHAMMAYGNILLVRINRAVSATPKPLDLAEFPIVDEPEPREIGGHDISVDGPPEFR